MLFGINCFYFKKGLLSGLQDHLPGKIIFLNFESSFRWPLDGRLAARLSLVLDLANTPSGSPVLAHHHYHHPTISLTPLHCTHTVPLRSSSTQAATSCLSTPMQTPRNITVHLNDQ
jgi:hypothetical protein